MATCIAPPRVLPAGFTLQLRNAPRWLNQLRKGRHTSLASAPHLTQSLTERWLAKEGSRRPRGFVVLAKVVSDVAPVTAPQEVDEGILSPQNKQTHIFGTSIPLFFDTPRVQGEDCFTCDTGSYHLLRRREFMYQRFIQKGLEVPLRSFWLCLIPK